MKARVPEQKQIPPAIAKLMKSTAYFDKKHPEHDLVKRQVSDHFKTVYTGDQPRSVITLMSGGEILAQEPYTSGRMSDQPDWIQSSQAAQTHLKK